jgi:hypothetical protein
MATDRKLARLWLVSILLCLGLGIGRVLLQKSHPPAWTTAGLNLHEGYVSIDGYADRAAIFRDWLAGKDEEARVLGEHLRESEHSTALLLPLVIALLAIPLGSVPIAFIVMSALGYLLQVCALTRLGAVLVPAAPRRAGLVAGILVGAHCLSMRTTGSLILDGYTAAFGTLAVLASLRWIERPDARRGGLLFLIQLAGTFIKLSYVPLLAAPALVALLGAGPLRWKRAATAGLLFGALPAIPVALYLHLVPSLSTLVVESGKAVERWGLTKQQNREYALELALFAQVLPLFLLRRASLGSPAVRAILAVTACTLAANLSIRPPINPRLYLAPLGFLIAAVTPGILDALDERRLWLGLLLFVALNTLVAILGTLAIVN